MECGPGSDEKIGKVGKKYYILVANVTGRAEWERILSTSITVQQGDPRVE